MVRRFKIPTLSNGLEESRNSIIIHKLHDILRPFLLRRLKVDVERALPPKKEYVLYALLSARQREVYDAVVKGSLRGLLAGAQPGEDARQRERDRIAREIEEDEKTSRVDARTRNIRGSITPAIESVSEIGTKYAFKVKSASLSPQGVFFALLTLESLRLFWGVTVKKVNLVPLQNVVMQLRKVCSHPFMFGWPLDTRMQQPVVDEQLVDASGKMMMRLLEALFERGQKVLVFSQFHAQRDRGKRSYPHYASLVHGRWVDRIGRSSSNAGHCAA